MKEFSFSRRAFIKSAACVAAVSSLPSCVTSQAGSEVRRPRVIAAGEKLNIACVGCGGKGKVDVKSVSSENIVALCDVDWNYAEKTFSQYPDARKFRDYREMLRKMDDEIDAVTVTTPDHMHYPVAKMAIEMGKHVYVQKPLTHSVWESRQLTELARKHKVATQMGNQGQASDSVRVLCEFLADGAIGSVREVHVWTNRPIWPQGLERPSETPRVPKALDWDSWLGVAPERPYNPIYHPFKWRGWWDFGTGALGDMGCHMIAPIFRSLKLKYPISVEASSSKVFDETYPLASTVRYEFPARGTMPPVSLTWYDGGLKPKRPAELEDSRELGNSGTLYIGDKGKMLDGRLIPEGKMRTYKYPPHTLPRSIGHYEEWIHACKGGEPGGSNFDIAGPLAEAVLLGNVALRTKKMLKWDAKKFRITNVPEANQYLRCSYRKGWDV